MSVLLQRLWIQITADRKRFGALCAMVAVGLLLWSRVILVSKVPRTAVAEDAGAALTKAPAGQTPAPPKRSRGPAPQGAGGASGDANKTGPAEPPKPAGPPIVIKLDREPGHDPFQINPEFFPRPNSRDPITELPAKSWTQTSDDPQQAANRQLSHVKKLIEQLELKAVIPSSHMAMINTRTYRLGERVDAGDDQVTVKLVAVKPRAVVLQWGAARFDLEIPQPQLEPR